MVNAQDDTVGSSPENESINRMNRRHSHICELSLTQPLKRLRHASVKSLYYNDKFEPPSSSLGRIMLVKIGSIIGFGMAVVGLLFLI